MNIPHNNDIDDHVDQEIAECLNLARPKSFFLFAGAGSGKTRSLVNSLEKIKKEYGYQLRSSHQKVAVITYTNAACDEITRRLNFDPLFSVSTIHSFVWKLIGTYTHDIKSWLKNNLQDEIDKLNGEQEKARGRNKSFVDREKKIDSKTKRLNNLPHISKFTYNPNGDNPGRDALNHSEVINLGAYFLTNEPLMGTILVQKYPVLLIDESQDTNKNLVDAFFAVQKVNKDKFSLGLFGDVMQRIYLDGKEKLEEGLPEDWVKPKKRMNHRCPKRVVTLINKIRSHADKQEQIPRSDKPEGFVRCFILPAAIQDKFGTEDTIRKKMAELTGDPLWSGDDKIVQTLTLEHHMAARRLGFFELFMPLYEIGSLSTSLLDGSASGLKFFSDIIQPLIEAKKKGDDMNVARIVRAYSPLMHAKNFRANENQLQLIARANEAVKSLYNLWEKSTPRLIDILRNVHSTGLFSIPESLLIIAERTENQPIADKQEEPNESANDFDEVINAWDSALQQSYDQLIAYHHYVSGISNFDTHQGVKGREFPRVMLVIDDSEARGFLFKYDKLFGAEPFSKTDMDNIAKGADSGPDRTRRLFYVACSRAEQSLAIVAYTTNPDAVNKTLLSHGWFSSDEIVM